MGQTNFYTSLLVKGGKKKAQQNRVFISSFNSFTVHLINYMILIKNMDQQMGSEPSSRWIQAEGC